MDSVKKEVRAALDKLQVAAVDHGWGRYAEPKTLANVRDAVEDAIMSALKRGAGVVVWSDMASAPTDGTVILTDAGTARWQGDFGPDDEGWYLCDAKGAIPSEWGNGSSDYRLQPTMWCEFNPAKRITSALMHTETPSQLTQTAEGQPEATQAAVEPSCVVTDAVDPDVFNPGIADPITDAVAELWARDFGLNHEDEEYDPQSPAWPQFCETQVDRGYGTHGQYWELSAITSWTANALTAALSSRTEEAREVPAYIRERADEEIAQIKASIGRDEQGQSDLPFAEVSGSDALRRRSLTNVGE